MAIELKHTKATDTWGAVLEAYGRVSRTLDREMRAETGLSLAWYEVLYLLVRSPDERLRMSDLADQTMTSRSAATRLVDRLVRDGLVERTTCPDDRRGTEVALTSAGRETFVEAGRVHLRGIEEHIGQHLTADEMTEVTEMLWRLANVQREAAGITLVSGIHQ